MLVRGLAAGRSRQQETFFHIKQREMRACDCHRIWKLARPPKQWNNNKLIGHRPHSALNHTVKVLRAPQAPFCITDTQQPAIMSTGVVISLAWIPLLTLFLKCIPLCFVSPRPTNPGQRCFLGSSFWYTFCCPERRSHWSNEYIYIFFCYKTLT